MKNHTLILAVFLSSLFSHLSSASLAETVTETRYYRSDIHRINGLEANRLETTNTNDADGLISGWYNGFPQNPCWRSDIMIRHADGTEETIATNAAQISGIPGGWDEDKSWSKKKEGYVSATWGCPQTILLPTDAIKIVEKMSDSYGTLTKEFITEPLGASELNSTTWTITRYILIGAVLIPPYFSPDQPQQWYGMQGLGWGSSTSNSRIEGFSYEVYVDIGLRVNDGTATRTIACDEGLTSHKLRIAKGGKIYGMVLVSPTHPKASKVLVDDGTSIKALRLF